MSHLIKIYTVCSLVFEFSIWYSLDLTFFLKFADQNFVVCFLVVKRELAVFGVDLAKWCKSKHGSFRFDGRRF